MRDKAQVKDRTILNSLFPAMSIATACLGILQIPSSVCAGVPTALLWWSWAFLIEKQVNEIILNNKEHQEYINQSVQLGLVPVGA